MKTGRFIRGLIAVGVVASSLLALSPNSAGAVSNTCYFSPTYSWVTAGTCSVSGYGAYGTNDVLPGRSTSGGTYWYAMPGSNSDYCAANSGSARCLNTKTKLISAISLARQGKDWYGNDWSGEARYQAISGAQFIIQQMLTTSRVWGGGYGTGYEAKDAWVALMQQSSVTISATSQNITKSSWYDTAKGNDFYYSYAAGTRETIRIYQDGVLLMTIEQACANPVDAPVQLKKQWTVAPYTNLFVNGVQDTTSPSTNAQVYPGDTIRWDYNARNLGPQSTNTAVDLRTGMSTDGAFIGFTNISSKASGWASGTYATASSSTFTPAAADVGHTYCRYYRANPGGYNGGTNYSTTWCVDVIARPNWSLVPSVGVDTPTASAGETVSVSYNVRNTGASATGASHTWRVSFLQYAPGQPTTQLAAFTPTGNVLSSSVCTVAPQSYTTCYATTPAPAATGTLSSPASNFSLNPAAITYNIPSGAVVGTKFCFVTSVSNPTPVAADDAQYRYSDLACVTVGVKPKVKILGLDARVGGIAQASGGKAGGRTYGSWVEYGIFSTDDNIYIGSGSLLLAGMSGPQNDKQYKWSPLTFRNDPPLPSSGPESFGNYGSVGDPAAFVQKLAAKCTSWVGDVSTSTTAPTTSAPLCSTGTVTINTNISDPGGNTGTLSGIGQKIILAQNIIINNLTNTGTDLNTVNAWLIAAPDPQNPDFDASLAAGQIDTCGRAGRNFGGAIAAAECDNQLTITGPVIANRLFLTRTYGVGIDAATTDPALAGEIINFRADAWLWAFNGGYGGSGGNVYQVTSIREVSPRF